MGAGEGVGDEERVDERRPWNADSGNNAGCGGALGCWGCWELSGSEWTLMGRVDSKLNLASPQQRR